MQPQKHKLLIADDHLLFIEGLKYILKEDLEYWKPEKNFLFRYRTPAYIEENKKLYQKELELVGATAREVWGGR